MTPFNRFTIAALSLAVMFGIARSTSADLNGFAYLQGFVGCTWYLYLGRHMNTAQHTAHTEISKPQSQEREDPPEPLTSELPGGALYCSQVQ